MPTQQLNKNVGIGGLDRGLCLIYSQGKTAGQSEGLFSIDISEAGLRQTTLNFATFDATKAPARGTKCSDFLSGNNQTSAILAQLGYLAAQSSKARINGEGDGIHGIDVLCEGALFDSGFSGAPIIAIDLTRRGNYTQAPQIVLTPAGPGGSDAHAVTKLMHRTQILANGGSSYTPNDILTAVGGTYDTGHPFQIQVDSVDSSSNAIVDWHVVSNGKYDVAPPNDVAFTGGTGSGATLTITWQIGYVIVLVGGGYVSAPAASLNGAFLDNDAGALGTVHLGLQQIISGSDFTNPFDPVTTVADTVEIPIQTLGGTTGSGRAFRARACGAMPAGALVGTIPVAIQGYVPMAPIDGVTLNVGDKVFLNDGVIDAMGFNHAGIYVVSSLGNTSQYWVMTFAQGLQRGDEIAVDEGNTNSGIWQATSQTSFSHTPATPGSGGPTYNVGLKVTIEYHAIELSFEYMSAGFVSEPRFLLNQYQLDANQEIVINRTTGRTMGLKIDSFTAIQQNLDSSGNITDGQTVAVAEATWRAAVKYIGTAAQFEQTPAGAYWHVKETATIKIMPIIAGLVAPIVPSS